MFLRAASSPVVRPLPPIWALFFSLLVLTSSVGCDDQAGPDAGPGGDASMGEGGVSDACATNNGGCDLMVACDASSGSVVCGACPAGYDGDGASGCVDVDECALDTDDCDVEAICSNTPGGFTCACPAGYTGDGTSCADVDECATDNGGCDVAVGLCTNTPGGSTCSCPAGYAGDGTSCADIDECATDNGGCDATAGICTNTPGESSCSCPAGYTGDGTVCADIDECAVDNGGCSAVVVCTNTAGAFTCGACPAGYLDDGAGGCTDIDECAAETDTCAQACVNEAGTFSCECGAGYALNADGFSCDDVDECATGNGGCSSGVTCTNAVGSFQCGACGLGQVDDGRGGCLDPCVNDLDCDGVLAADDCDDRDPASTVRANDADCDGFETSVDCDDTTDEEGSNVWFVDGDRDGFGDPESTVLGCTIPDGASENGDDCDDGAMDISPGAPELCDGVDHDCDGVSHTGDIVVGASSPDFAFALAGATDGSVVCVEAGVYTGSLIVGASVTIYAPNGPELTVVDAEGEGWSFFTDGHDITLRGLTFRNGWGAFDGESPGLYLRNGTHVLEDLVLTGHRWSAAGTMQGGAIHIAGGGATLTDIEITDLRFVDSNLDGAAIFVSGAVVNATRVRITDVYAEATNRIAGLIFVDDPAAVTWENVILAGNELTRGDASAMIDTTWFNTTAATLRNWTVVGNQQDTSTNTTAGTAIIRPNGTSAGVTLVNMLLAGNTSPNNLIGAWNPVSAPTTASYSTSVGSRNAWGRNVTLGTGLVTGAPTFADTSSMRASDWDLRLAAGSPQLDAGDPAILDADGSRSDIGAYGGPNGF